MHRVLWLPTHPLMGAVSMNRYWREMDRQSRQQLPGGGQRDVEILSPLGAPPPTETRRGSRLARFWQKYVAYPRLARRAARAPGVTTLHVFDHAFAHLLKGVPRTVRKLATVHDLAPLRDGGDLNAGQVRRFRRTVEHLRLADLVLAVSRFSAEEAIEFLDLDPARVRVLPEGVDVEAFSHPPAVPPAWAEALADRQVVFSIGMSAVRKNLDVLPAVFQALHEGGGTGGSPLLLRVGDRLPGPLSEKIRAVLGSDGLLELGRVSDDAVVFAYHRAAALLLPSRQEGFGFPVLEAMAAGCPVVCTDVSSLPEVGGQAALYFNPDDPAAAAAHLRTLLTDPAARALRVAAGRRQAATLTWQRHYERLLEVYREESCRPEAAP